MNLKLESGAGEHFKTVAEKAKKIATEQGVIVEFEFNGVLCLVENGTILDNLFRDYSNAHTMEWKTVGPECQWQYDVDTEIELLTRQLEGAKKRKAYCDDLRKKDKEEEDALTARVSGIEFKIIAGREEEYAEYAEKNSKDGYSKAVVEYAEAWAKVMQKNMNDGKSISDVADISQEGLGYLGITGFQYGCAVNALSRFWLHGDSLREWHNAKYGVSKDKKGVVNPAILTLKD